LYVEFNAINYFPITQFDWYKDLFSSSAEMRLIHL